MSSDYGALKDLVASAGAIMAAVTAIGVAWRGRADWEPSEEDLPSGAQKVGGVVAAVLIVLAWTEWRDPEHNSALNDAILRGIVATVLSLLVTAFIVGTQTYKKVVVAGAGTRDLRIIGGFWLTKWARRERTSRNLTTQKLFAGSAYDEDVLWPRPSRQLAKLLCTLGYLGLTVGGTVTLALAAIRLGLAVG